MPDGALALLAFGNNEELKELGKLTILFASLDEAIANISAAMLADFPHLSNLHDGQPITELRFEDKQDLMKKLVRQVARLHDFDATDLIDALGEAKKASKDRNRVIHGWLTWDYEGGRPVFRGKTGQHVPAALDEIRRINAAIGTALQGIVTRFGELLKRIER